jgi:hypothetical protein
MAATLVYEMTGSKLEPFIDPQSARTLAVQMAPNLTVVKGTRLAQLTADGKYSPYVSAGAGGLGAAKVIAVYDFRTDAAGNVFYGNNETPLSGPNSKGELTAEAYWKGTFLRSDLTAAAAIGASELGDLNAREIGTGADTIVHIA